MGNSICISDGSTVETAMKNKKEQNYLKNY